MHEVVGKQIILWLCVSLLPKQSEGAKGSYFQTRTIQWDGIPVAFDHHHIVQFRPRIQYQDVFK